MVCVRERVDQQLTTAESLNKGPIALLPGKREREGRRERKEGQREREVRENSSHLACVKIKPTAM